ncbi:MAG: CBS domain-containing protein [Planctomycetota bacterium]
MTSNPSEGGFQDPLENYDPPEYSDALEKALAEEPVSSIRSWPVSTVGPGVTAGEAVRVMSEGDAACLLVVEDGELVGTFSVRDVLNSVSEDFESSREKPLREVMTKSPTFVYDSDASGAALSVMAVTGFRHVPVLDSDETVRGIINPQRVTDFLLKHIGGV